MTGLAAKRLRHPNRPCEGREWKSESRDGLCEVKREQKRRGSLLEVKCKDGIGARWRGEWKQECRHGRCVVKVDAKRDEYKQEMTCAAVTALLRRSMHRSLTSVIDAMKRRKRKAPWDPSPWRNASHRPARMPPPPRRSP